MTDVEMKLAKLEKQNAEFRGLLLDVLDYLAPMVDIKDGEDGPLPNEEMSLSYNIEVALGLTEDRW